MWLAVAAVGCVGGLVGHVVTRAVQTSQSSLRNKAVQLPSNAPLDLEEALRLLKERHAALEAELKAETQKRMSERAGRIRAEKALRELRLSSLTPDARAWQRSVPEGDAWQRTARDREAWQQGARDAGPLAQQDTSGSESQQRAWSLNEGKGRSPVPHVVLPEQSPLPHAVPPEQPPVPHVLPPEQSSLLHAVQSEVSPCDAATLGPGGLQAVHVVPSRVPVPDCSPGPGEAMLLGPGLDEKRELGGGPGAAVQRATVLHNAVQPGRGADDAVRLGHELRDAVHPVPPVPPHGYGERDVCQAVPTDVFQGGPPSQSRQHDDIAAAGVGAGRGLWMEGIGVVRSCFWQRNGTPRQPLLVPAARARLLLRPGVPHEALEGLEQYSHCWILYLFHENTDLGSDPGRGFKGKVRVPRLNGGRVGVFATRSPHRPIPIGQSVAKVWGNTDPSMAEVEGGAGLSVAKIEGRKGGALMVSGCDVLDGSPLLDVKPYVPFCDCLPCAIAPPWVAREAPEVEPLRVAAVRFAENAGAQLEEAWFLNRQCARQRNDPVLYPDFPPFRQLVEEVLSRDIRSVHQRQHAARSAVQGRERRQVPAPEVPQDTESNLRARHNPDVCSVPEVLHDSEARPQAIHAPDTCGSRDVLRDSDASPQVVHGPVACALHEGAEPGAPPEFQEGNEGAVSENAVSGRTPQLASEERFDAEVDCPGDAGREPHRRSPGGYPQSRVHPNMGLEKETAGTFSGDGSFLGKDVGQGSPVVCLNPDPERHPLLRDDGHDLGSTAQLGSTGSTGCQARGLSAPTLLYRNAGQEKAVEQRAREPRGQYKVVLDGVQVGYDIDEQGCVLICSARRVERGLLAA